MNEPDYVQILANLTAAHRVLEAHRGELSSGDMRIGQLISAAEAEARRQCEVVRPATEQPLPSSEPV